MPSDAGPTAWFKREHDSMPIPWAISIMSGLDMNELTAIALRPGVELPWVNSDHRPVLIPSSVGAAYSVSISHTRDPFAVVESLKDNWDGEGALAPTQSILDTVRRVLKSFAGIVPLPEVTANVNGTVSIEWEYGADYASVEIGASTFAFIMRARGGRTRFIGGDPTDLDATTALEIESGLFRKLTTPAPTVGIYASR